jgi:hypothetical protein
MACDLPAGFLHWFRWSVEELYQGGFGAGHSQILHPGELQSVS